MCATNRTTTCFVEALQKFENESLHRTSGVDRCDCKPACTSMSFDSETHYSPADGIDFIYQQLGVDDTDELVTNTCHSIEIYFSYIVITIYARYSSSIVSILYQDSDFIPLKRSELFGKSDLVASCGGILGLFLGISLISCIEFVYFCAVRPFFYLKQEKVAPTPKINQIRAFASRDLVISRRTSTQHKY